MGKSNKESKVAVIDEETLEQMVKRAKKLTPKTWGVLLSLVVIITAVCAIIILGKVVSNTKAKLTYAESQVEVMKKSTNALQEQVTRLNTEKEDVNNKLEELLNVHPAVPVITKTLLEEQISSLSELVTKKYFYRYSVQKEDKGEWLWGVEMPLTKTSFIATFDGTITAGIDLSLVKFNINEETKTITVTMPKSKIFEHNIPQETLNIIGVKDNLLKKVTLNDPNRAIAASKGEVEQNAIGQGFLKEADREARLVLENFISKLPGIEQYKLIFK